MSVLTKKMFPGGIHPHEKENGKAVNGGNEIRELPAPARVTIPLSQHIGAPAKAVVKAGDHVLVGQVIGEAGGFVSAPVHASVSGVVFGVQNCLLADGTSSPAVIIDNDYQDTWVELQPTDHPETLKPEELQSIIRSCGIVGLGGAAFPTAVKMAPPKDAKIEYLLINGAECEPYLTADHRLMLEKPGDIVDGIRLMMLALNIPTAIIGIENNKPDAIARMAAACEKTDGISVKALPVRYPQGGEKQLTYALTRRKVPCGALPSAVGVIVCNVGTAYAVHNAVREGRPLIDRVTTVGGLVNNPGNFLVRIGTSVEYLLEACGGMQPGVKQFIYGGPMMGRAVARTDIPVVKGCSGLVALGDEAMEPKESPCIHCGRCLRACPMQLNPTRIDAATRKDLYEEAEAAGAMNCLECGACTFSCPAKRSLTQSIRVAKKVINTRRARAKAAAAAAKAKEEAERKAAEEAAKAAAAAAEEKKEV